MPVVSDDFNRTGSLGANWTVAEGSITCDGAKAVPGSTGNNIAYYSGSTFGGDQFAESTIGPGLSSGNWAYAMARRQPGAATNYEIATDGATDIRLSKLIDFSWTMLASTTTAFPIGQGDKLKIVCQGSSISAQKNGVEILSVVDTSITGGYPGIKFWASGVPTCTIDAWTGGDLDTTGFAHLGNAATANHKTSSSTWNFPVDNSAINAGELAVLVIALDNVQTTDGETTLVSSVTDSVGNTWQKAIEFTNGQGGAAAGATVSIWYSKIATTIPQTSGSITVNLASAVAAKAATVHRFNVDANVTVQVAATATRADDAVDPGSVSLSGLTSRQYLAIRGIAAETSSTTALTPTSGWTAMSGTQTSGSGTATNMAVRGEFQIATATAFSSDPTYTAADCASALVAFYQVPSGPAGSLSATTLVSLSAAGTVAVQGSLTAQAGQIPVGLAAQGVVAVQGAASGQTQTGFAAQGVVAIQGAVDGQTQTWLAATGTVVFGATGDLASTTLVSLSAQGAVLVAGQVVGQTATRGTADGGVLVQGAASGQTVVALAAQGAVGVSGQLAAQTPVSIGATGAVAVAGQLAAQTTVVPAAHGAVTVAGQLAGQTLVQLAASGAVTVAGQLAAQTLVQSAAQGAVLVQGALAAQTRAQLAATGVLGNVVTGQLVATTLVALGAAGAVAVQGGLAGIVPVVGALQGGVLVQGGLSAIAPVASVAQGGVLVQGALAAATATQVAGTGAVLLSGGLVQLTAVALAPAAGGVLVSGALARQTSVTGAGQGVVGGGLLPDPPGRAVLRERAGGAVLHEYAGIALLRERAGGAVLREVPR